jgi:L-aminopeptidase/D-esterase-like protein
MKMKKIDIGDIEGFRLGNAENAEAGTGVTVIISEEGAVAGVDVRGGGPATRETDLLRPENTVDKVHAVVLSGGSAFGLEAASGVMRSLAERSIGFQVDEGIYVPIVPGASLYDLPVGRSDVFPDVNMGRAAVENAYSGEFSGGNHGAGTGATVGKYMGYGRAMKTGLGTFACGDDFVQVGAVTAVNAIGDIYNGAGNIIAGLRTVDGSAIKGTIRVLKGMVHDESSPDLDLTDIKTIAAAEALKKKSDESRAEISPVHVNDESHSEENAADEKNAIVKAMMDSYNQENPPAVEDEYLNITEPEETHEPAIVHAEEFEEPAEPAANVPSETEEHAHETASVDLTEEHEAAPAEDMKETRAYTADQAGDSEPAVQAESEAPEKAAASEETAAPVEDEYILTEEDKLDMGYDIPFNTVISCVITNAELTKAQACKLAQILHDAYARAIKPVHGTLDGDTIFVMASGKQKVNFDAFAALATDVLQYAIIDGASSAEGAYGLPAARDMIHN